MKEKQKCKPSVTLVAQPPQIAEGGVVSLKAEVSDPDFPSDRIKWEVEDDQGRLTPDSHDKTNAHWDTTGLRNRVYSIKVSLLDEDRNIIASAENETPVHVTPRPVSREDILPVSLRRNASPFTSDLALWVVIKKGTEALSFKNYKAYMDLVLCGTPLPDDVSGYERKKIEKKEVFMKELEGRRHLPYTDAEAYRLLKVATEAFVVVNCGIMLRTFPFEPSDLKELQNRVELSGIVPALADKWEKEYLKEVNGMTNKTLPYLAIIRKKMPDVEIKDSFCETDFPQECFGILREKLIQPCFLELIWSYWHEEGMLVQTLNALSRRFQNKRGRANKDPLAHVEIGPLRPLNNILWGYIQDEPHRLSVVRRTYEYNHHYGLRLDGKAIKDLRPADSRSKFLESFHNLLHLCTSFFQQDDDTTVVADGFPILNGLKEVHLVLSEGMHNQFGDLPSTARIEMLMQQWLLARPEFREFLPTRVMVAYPEPWMDRVDAMKKLQGWTDSSVMSFHGLAVFGEQILLSIRFGAWSTVTDPAQAANWAKYWRAEIQGYMHAYRVVTGQDLTSDSVDFTLPSVHLKKRLALQLQGQRG